MYNIKLLKTAHIECANSVIYKNGLFEEVTKIGCHAFLLNKGEEYYLIDTGIEDIDVANKTKSSVDDWARYDDEHAIKENLDLIGVDCDKITKVFITHAHYDHISGAKYFKNAVFYMTKTFVFFAVLFLGRSNACFETEKLILKICCTTRHHMVKCYLFCVEI